VIKSVHKEILDFDMLTSDENFPLNSIENMMDESEKLIWTGKPKYVFSLTPLEVGGHDVMLGPTNLYFLGLGAFWFFSFKAYQDSNFFLMILSFVAGLAVFILPDIIKEVRRRRTFYVVTTKRVFFVLSKLKKQSIHQLKLEEVHDIKYEGNKDKSGVLYLIPKNKVDFKTYNFFNGESRHYPTFENIEEVVSLWEKVKELKRKIVDNNR